jgi:short-subunit dehydrogenase
MTDTKPLAVVTGASSGIGHELAKQFAEHGFDLLICAEDVGLAAAADGLRAGGADVQTVQSDSARTTESSSCTPPSPRPVGR